MRTQRLWLYLLLAAAVIYHGLIVYHIFFSRLWMTDMLSGNLWGGEGGRVISGGTRDMGLFGQDDLSRGNPLQSGDVVVRLLPEKPADPAALEPLRDLGELHRDLSAWSPGRPLYAVVLRGSPSRLLVLKMPAGLVARPRWTTLAGYFLIVEATPFVFLICAFLIGFQRRGNPQAWIAVMLFYTFPALINMPLIALPQAAMAYCLLFRYICGALPFYFAFRLFLLFPKPSPVQVRFPWAGRVAWWVTVAYTVLRLLYRLETLGALPPGEWSALVIRSIFYLFYFMEGLLLLGLVSLTLNTFRAKSPTERRQLGFLWAGALSAMIGLFSSTVYQLLFGVTQFWFTTVLILLVGMLPLSFLYAGFRGRLPGFRLILRSGIRHLLASKGFLLAESALLFILFTFYVGPAAESLFPGTDRRLVHAVFLTAVLVVILGLNRLNPWILSRIDRRFFREALDAQSVLTELGRTIRSLAASPADLVARAATTIGETLHLGGVRVILPGRRGIGPSALVVRSGQETDSWTCVCAVGEEAGAEEGPEELTEAVVSVARAAVERAEEAGAAPPDCLDIPVEAEPGETSDMARLRAGGVRLVVAMTGPAGVMGFLALGEKRSEEPFTREDRRLLLTVTEQIALALDYARLLRETLERDRVRREMEFARDVQARLFPQVLYPMERLAYAGTCRPAGDVGGDYYDFIPLGNGKLGIALGDISGKGMAAALIMAGLQGMLRVSAPLWGTDVSSLVSTLNRRLVESTPGDRFATFFYAVFDDAERRLTYVNAGHNPPVLLPADGGSPRLLETGGPIMGIFPDPVYETGRVVLSPGDLVFLYSDGLTEAADGAGAEFGEERLLGSLPAWCGGDAEACLRLALKAVDTFSNGVPQRDDITLTALRVR